MKFSKRGYKNGKGKINKLILETNGKEIELSLDEAKELYEQLGSLFEKEVQPITLPIYIERDRWNPLCTKVWRDYPAIPNEPYCSASGNSGLKVSYCGE